MKMVKDLSVSGYPRHTKTAVEGARRCGHKKVKVEDGTIIEAFQEEEGIVIVTTDPKTNKTQVFLYQPSKRKAS